MTSSALHGRPAIGLLVSDSPGDDVPANAGTHLPSAPPSTAAPRFLSNYWPVFAGAGIAMIVVIAGLAWAVSQLERAGDQPAVTSVEPKPNPTAAPAAVVPPSAPPKATTKPAKVSIANPKTPLAAVPAKVVAPFTTKDAPPELNLPDAQPIDIGIEVPKEAAKGIGKALLDEPPGGLPKCETYGTAINFVRTPLLAAKHAQAEDKLVFTLHVSGNFEDPGFT